MPGHLDVPAWEPVRPPSNSSLPLMNCFRLLWLPCFTFLLTAKGAMPESSVGSKALEWADVPSILKRIEAPKFPDASFDITKYGAKADGRANSLPAIREAIEACSRAGGGHVL